MKPLSLTVMLKRLCFFVLLYITLPGVALACTCARSESTCGGEWKHGEVVFLGKVTAKVPRETKARVGDQEIVKDRRNEFTFSVIDSFQGNAGVGDDIVVETGLGGGDCGYPFFVGSTYLVYANFYNNKLTTGICNQTAPEVQAKSVIRQLRAVREGAVAASLFGTIGVAPRGNGYEDLMESNPLAEVRVRAISSTAKNYSATTDADGVYTFESLPRDTYRLEVELPVGYSTWLRNQGKEIQFEIGAGSTCRVDVWARVDGRISGVVVNALGQPFDGFVTLRPVDRALAERTRLRGGLPGSTTQDGKFLLWQIPAGRYVLVFHPKVGGRVDFRVAPFESAPIELKLGEHLEGYQLKLPEIKTPLQ